MEHKINLMWDTEAGVWIATSEDVEGLVLESGSVDVLIERVRFAIPELLKLNNKADSETVNLHFLSERYEKVAL